VGEKLEKPNLSDRCVYYPRLKCPVRGELARISASRSIKAQLSPVPTTDEERVAMKLVQALAKLLPSLTDSELLILSFFCTQCVKKEYMDMKYRQKTGLPYLISIVVGPEPPKRLEEEKK
jgi:hypothetical protein